MRHWLLLLGLATWKALSAPQNLASTPEPSHSTNSSIDTSTWEFSSSFSYSSASQILHERKIFSSASSQSWSVITRPQIKHPETTPMVQGAGNGQAVVLAEPTAEQCKPSTALAAVVTCVPVADTTKAVQACKTTFTETSGCDIDPSPTTRSITASTLTVHCGQDSCRAGSCNIATTKANPSGIKCKDCSTSKGMVFAPEKTIPLSGSKSTSASAATPSTHKERDDVETTVEKRTLMEVRQYRDFDHFTVQQVIQAEAEGNLVPHRPADTGGRSSAKVKKFTKSGNNMAVKDLDGCTSIMLVSRRGVWMSHHWEKPTFLAGPDGRDTIEEDVLVGMFTGDNSGWFPGLNQFSGDGDESLFNTETYGQTKNKVQPIIFTPYIDPAFYGDPDRPWRFLPDVTRIMDQLHQAYGVEPIVRTYHQLEGTPEEVKETFKNTARGKFLLQFDAQQSLATVHTPEGVCYEQESIVRVWSDTGHKIYEDQFPALPETNVFAHLQQNGKRSQESQIDWSRPYCGLPKDEPKKCKITSAPATTFTAHTVGTSKFPAQTIAANTFCQCGKTIAGVETRTGSDGRRSLYCNNGSVRPTKPATVLPPPETCYLTSAPATTMPPRTIGTSVMPAQTIAANTYCQCSNKIAGVRTKTGSDGATSYYCENGGPMTSAVTRKPPPSKCTMKSSPATTHSAHMLGTTTVKPAYTIAAATFCQCGDDIRGLNTVTGKDAGLTVMCDGGSMAESATSTPKPVPITTMAPKCELVKGGSCKCGDKPGTTRPRGQDGFITYDCVVGTKTWEAFSTVQNPHAPRPSCEILKSGCKCGGKPGTTRPRGHDGIIEYDCVVGTKTWSAVSSTTNSFNAATIVPKKTCRLNLREYTKLDKGGDWSLTSDSQLELYVDGTYSKGQVIGGGTFSDTFKMTRKYTGLQNDIVASFGATSDTWEPPKKRDAPLLSTRKWTQDFVDFSIFVGYGRDGSWQSRIIGKNNDTGQLDAPDPTKFPYCQMGKWDLHGRENDDGLAGLDSTKPGDSANRESDCFFKCQ